MAQAVIFQIPATAMINFYAQDPVVAAKEFAANDSYEAVFAVPTKLTGEAAAEDLFDLSNNPNRQEERSRLWAHRSLSVGDVVHVNLESWLCCSSGWTKL